MKLALLPPPRPGPVHNGEGSVLIPRNGPARCTGALGGKRPSEMAENVLKGKRIMGSTRAPKTVTGDRTCAKVECETTLSRYNKREFCYAHAPTKFPRLRGRIVTES